MRPMREERKTKTKGKHFQMTAVEKEERLELERVIEKVKQRKGDCMIKQGKQRKEDLFGEFEGVED